MADTWNELQQIKNKRLSLREKLAQRKRTCEDILTSTTASANSTDVLPPPSKSANLTSPDSRTDAESSSTSGVDVVELSVAGVERAVLDYLNNALDLPADSKQLTTHVEEQLQRVVAQPAVDTVLQKLAAQDLISVRDGGGVLEVVSVEHDRLRVVSSDTVTGGGGGSDPSIKSGQDSGSARQQQKSTDDIMNLLSLPSALEKESKRLGDEILDLLSKPTVKERSTAEQFRSQGGAQVQEYCRHGTRHECRRISTRGAICEKLHFFKILQKHTDESLGDCSFLNTCFHMDTCKYVHYEVDYADLEQRENARAADSSAASALAADAPSALQPALQNRTVLFQPQWIQCDLRMFDMSVIGECAVIMADPPWDIHMELPYGTMADDEMRNLNIPSLQTSGLFFLWVTGRAMELGRECLQLWGYERVDELIWVKTNQLQRIIRTGRTGHWLNHGKEHCLVGMKGEAGTLNRGLDADVLVAEVRATSHKPDEIYGIIERLSPGTRKLELFGRPHNAQPNWITLGNQLDGVNLSDPEIVERFRKRYPHGDAMKPPVS